MESGGLQADESSQLYELDRTHWRHPQGDLDAPAGTIPQLIFTSGQGATLTDVAGREYIDGMASLWNVNVGYGRTVLADAAAEQMKTLAFSSAYGGFGTAPAIRLAAKLADLALGDLDVTYFASGGAEANAMFTRPGSPRSFQYSRRARRVMAGSIRSRTLTR